MSEFPFDDFKETDFNEFERFFKTNTVNPIYDHRANFQTNSPSFYEYLAKHNHLIKILAKRIYDYDKELAKRFEEWDKRIENLPEEIEDLLKEWLTNGEIDRIINEAFGLINDIYVNVTLYGATDDGITDNTPMIKQAEENGHILYFPKKIGKGYLISEFPEKQSLGKGSFLKFINPNYLEASEEEKQNIEEFYFMYLDDKALDVNSFWQNYIQLNNTDLGINAGKKLDKDSYGNVAIGNNSMRKAETEVIKNISIGHNALSEMKKGYQNTAIGTDVMRDTVLAERNTVIGSNAGIGMGDSKVVGNNHMFRPEVDTTYLDELWQDWRQYAGSVTVPKFVAKNRADTRGNTAVGRNSMGWTITPEFCTAMGYNSLEKGLNAKNVVSIGTNNMVNTIKPNSTVSVGTYANQYTSTSEYDTVLGVSAMRDLPHSMNNVAIGFQALIGSDMERDNPTVERNIAIGRFSMANNSGLILRNTAVGDHALRFNTNSDNTAIGEQALVNNENGKFNTAIGKNSAGQVRNGKYVTALGYNALNSNEFSGYENITGVGSNATVTGSNQLQLGNSATDVYAFNALQTRSDERDKTDIKDSDLGLEFINKLRPVKYKWNLRDGTMKGKRYHYGLSAQELEQVTKDLEVDFGGLQHHEVNGGQDVYSVGYTELIAPMIKAIQELTNEVNTLKSEIKELKGV